MQATLGSSRRIGTLLLVCLLALAAWFQPLDAATDEKLDAGLKRAFATFAAARALNGVISLIQSGQVGAGVSVNPGELLDPVNDLVEQFSDFMLAATVAFGAQKVLLAIGAHWLVPLLLTAAAIAWVLREAVGGSRPRWLVQLFTLLLLVRFAIPVATLGTDVLYRAFLASKYEASQQAIGQVRAEVDPTGLPDAGSADKGVVDRMKDWLSKGTELRGQAERILEAAGKMAEHLTNLMVVFLFQTLVFPIALLWLLYQVARTVLRADWGAGPASGPLRP